MTTPALSGRRGQAARNDATILAAARGLPRRSEGPIAAVAERAGVGISALYRRYANKEDLLRRLCHDGLRRYNAEAEAALAAPDGWAALRAFLIAVVTADVHSLTVRLAGTFTPTPDMGTDAERAAELAGELFERARPALRPGIVLGDLTLVLEGCAAIRLPGDPERTAELRRRHLELLLTGLSARDAGPLPGPGPRPGELSYRWSS